MRTLRLLFALLALASVSFAQDAGNAQRPTKVSDIKIPPLHEFHPEQPKRIQLPNGAVVFLIEDHEIPLIDFTAMFRGGSRDEPAAKVGLSDIFGEVWRTGGTTSKTGDLVDDLLEAHAAKLETDSGIESTSISGNCLKQDFDTVFNLMLDFIQSPAFREEKIDLAKDEMRTGISRRNDSVGAIAGRESVRLAYGKDNPYARIAEYWTVGAVTRADLVNWHKKYVGANNMIFGISGDFNAAEMEAKLRKALGALPKATQYAAPKINFEPPKPGVYFVNKEDVNQSQIRMVALGTERRNPDYFALQVMNEAFGGGFSSRLFSSIRTKQGLAYTVGGAYGAGWDHPGVFDVETGTQSGNTVKAIRALNEEVDDVVKRPFSAEEVNRAKDSLLNAFVFRFDSKDKVLRERMTYEFYGYPADFLQRYHDAVEKMGVDDVNRVARKYINRAQLAILVVGNQKDFGESLSTFGQVTPVDITIPEEAGNGNANGGSAAADTNKPTVSTPEGKALLAKALQWAGGVDKLAAVKSVAYQYTATVKTPQGELQVSAKSQGILPDHIRQSMTVPQGEITTIISPTGGVQQMGGQSRPMSKDQIEEYLAGLKRTSLYVARHANDPAYTFTSAGAQQVNRKQASVLAISGEGQNFRWLVDPQTGEILGSQYRANGPTGPAQREDIYSDYKAVNGIQTPFAITITNDGQPFVTSKIEQYQIDPELDASLFEANSASSSKQ
ncbi:MAG TPA: pitrilysin family protein [Terriglobales bacterium]